MIKEEMVEVTPTGVLVKYYSSLGYEPIARKPLLVNSLHLNKSSSAMVTRICDSCGDEKVMRKVKVKSTCKSCTAKSNNEARKDLSKTTCPKCGGRKSYRAEHCQSCVDMSGENNPLYGKPNKHIREWNAKQKPEDHWNWKGGSSKDRSGKILKWAREVKLIGACDICGFDELLALDAHHLDSYERGSELNHDVSNGVCLCKNHHAIFHKTYGYGDNTKAQYIEFKEKYNG